MPRWGFLVLLAVGSLCIQGFALPTTTDQNVAAGYLNPGDQRILVQTIEIQGDTRPTLINAVTIQNLGTASSSDITRIELANGDGMIGFTNNPLGLSSAGTTILTDYTVPAGATVRVNVYVDIALATAISGGETLQFQTRFYYAAVPAPSWVVDGTGEEIRKAGFETIDDSRLEEQYFNPNDEGVIQRVAFTDIDANASPLTVKKIIVRNAGSATLADLKSLTVSLTYSGSGEPVTVTKSEREWGEDTSWQDGGIEFVFGELDERGNPVDPIVIDDETSMTVEVVATIIAEDPLADPPTSAPTSNRTMRTSVEVQLEENQQSFTQTSLTPATQTIRVAGIEQVEDHSSVPPSHVLSSGEVLTQTLTLMDHDVNTYDVEVTSIFVKNSGTAQGREIQDVVVRNNGVEIGRLPRVTSLSDQFVEIPLSPSLAITDDGTATIVIQYVIGVAAPGHTLQPVAKVTDYENSLPYYSELSTYPEQIVLYPAGLEVVENVSPGDGGPESGNCARGQRFLAQMIRCVDQDENSADVTLGPIIIRNQGTTIGNQDVVKIEIETSAGDKVGETSDLAGFETGGVAVSNLRNNVVADKQAGSELILNVYVTMAENATIDEDHPRTVELETTVFNTEDGGSYAGIVDGSTFLLKINHPPTVDFTFAPEVPNIGDDVHFTAAVTDPDEGDKITSYAWQFGDSDSGISREENPVYAFTGGGTFEVTLTAADDKGVTGTKTRTIVVNRAPEGDFDWAPHAPDVDEDVAFTTDFSDADDPQDVPFTYAWDFGDRTSSSEANPTHAFTEMTTYDVSVTVTDSRGGKIIVEQEVTVGNEPPVVDFTWEPVSPEVGERVVFAATVTDPDDPADTPFSYSWDFGDDETSTAASPTHTYAEKKNYTVALTVTDARRGKTTASKTLAVGNEPPVASFDVSEATVTTGETVQFTDTSTDSDGTVTQWMWDFGDRTPLASTENPTHIYTTAGTYTVSLMVTDDKGTDSVAASREITVVGPPQVVTHSYPNPAATQASIVYYLPTGATDPVLRIYNITGALVFEHDLTAGESPYVWDLDSTGGTAQPNGLYLCVVVANNNGSTIKSPIFKLLIAR